MASRGDDSSIRVWDLSGNLSQAKLQTPLKVVSDLLNIYPTANVAFRWYYHSDDYPIYFCVYLLLIDISPPPLLSLSLYLSIYLSPSLCLSLSLSHSISRSLSISLALALSRCLSISRSLLIHFLHSITHSPDSTLVCCGTSPLRSDPNSKSLLCFYETKKNTSSNPNLNESPVLQIAVEGGGVSAIMVKWQEITNQILCRWVVEDWLDSFAIYERGVERHLNGSAEM